MFSKKFWLILISAAAIGTPIVLACAGDDGPEYGNSNFTPEAFVDSAYSAFFYSNLFYYGIDYDDKQLTRFNQSNLLEWSAYLEGKIPAGKLAYLLDSADDDFVRSAAHSYTGSREAAFFQYLRLAKDCEHFSTNPIPNYWDTDTTKKQKVSFDTTTLHRQLRAGLAGARDTFVKERYWFQLVRSCFYNGSPEETIAIFNAYSFPHNTTWYRSLAYMAGACHQQKDYAHANYYYSRVFDGCNELKTVAHYSFHPEEEKDWQATLALCSSAEEKATLWQMLGIFYADPTRAIREIYTLDPRSDKMEVLLSRAVNIAEQGFGARSSSVLDSADRALLTLVDRIARADNTNRPWIWQLAAGYLNTLDARYAVADNWYDKARKTISTDKLPQAQYRLLRLLNKVAAAPRMTTALENQWRADLTWLTTLNPNEPAFRFATALGWVKRTISDKYAQTGDKVKSECFRSNTAFYTDNRNVEALKAFLDKPDKTPYEQLCARLSDKQRGDLFEYQAITWCMKDRIDEAVSAMKQAPNDTTVLPGNPFNARIQDCHDCDFEAPQKVKYSKTSFLAKLKELKDKITAGQDVFTNAVLLGNAQYNITQYGNARVFYECKVLGSDHGEAWSIDSDYRADLLSMAAAEKYYTLALGAAKTDEQRAKCQYLLAKCQRNDWYTRTPSYNSDQDGPAFQAWDGFKALKQYAGTQYYKDVIRECGYFKTYIRHSASK